MLSRLRLRDFRPFGELVLEPSAGTNFIVGGNALGKTSILEAACLLLRLQSPRTSSPGDCIRFGCEGFGIEGQWGDRHLQMKYAGRLKSFSLDSKDSVPASEYLSVARVIWISNSDLEFVTGGASGRRRFLDFLGVQLMPGYLKVLRSYERALRSRNTLLRDGRPEREVAAFDAPLIVNGDYLLKARSELSTALLPHVTHALHVISASQDVLQLTYHPGSTDPMASALDAVREEDFRTTSVGPHRDDVGLMLNSRPAANFASEGQQRALALALKLGQAGLITASLGQHPLYLIDDIFGELDTPRRNRLLPLLPSEAQKLITTTSLVWMHEQPAESRIMDISSPASFLR